LAPTILHGLHFPGRLQAAFFDSLHAIGFALLILQSILHPDRGFYRFLNWKWVKHVGVLSYSIYIWQQMFCGTDETVFGVKGAWWVSFPIWIFIALLVAHISYFLLEKPLLGLRARFRAE
jgi:peptidoglycan/LPS O-acetylase OafA/YrhL